MAKNVLIADSDKGFSTILKEGLDSHPSFNALAVHSGAKALRLVVEKKFDLIIIDMGISDVPPLKLVQSIRQAKPDMAIMIIPLIGQEVPKNITKMNIQGVLPKPFFVGDLPRVVGEAVGLDIDSEVPDLPVAETKADKKAAQKQAPPPPPRPSRPSGRGDKGSAGEKATRTVSVELPTLPSWKLEQLYKNKDEIYALLKDLNGEIRAEVILLTAGTELVAKAGTMNDDRAQELAILVAESAGAVSQVAAFLGERDKQFEQSLHEGNEFRVYSYGLGQGVVLSLALGMNVPLGILRHQTKQTSKQLAKYIK